MLRLGAQRWSAWQDRGHDAQPSADAPLREPPPAVARPSVPTAAADGPLQAAAGWSDAAHAHLAHYEARIAVATDPEDDAGPSAAAVRRRRIAIRRLRLVAALISPTPDDAAPIDRALRRLGRGLGEVRDRDLATAAMREYLRAHGESELGALERAALDELQAWIDARRGRRASRVGARDEAAAIDAALASLHAALAPWWADEALARDRAAQWCDAAAITVRERLAATYGDLDVEPLHELRIAARRLRYGLEFVGALAPAEAASLLPWCRRLQSVIGRHRDAVLWQTLLRRRIDRALGHHRYALARGLEPARQAATRARTAAWEDLAQALVAARSQLRIDATR